MCYIHIVFLFNNKYGYLSTTNMLRKHAASDGGLVNMGGSFGHSNALANVISALPESSENTCFFKEDMVRGPNCWEFLLRQKENIDNQSSGGDSGFPKCINFGRFTNQF